MSADQALMARAFRLAEAALARGERPVAALLVFEGAVVAEAGDAVFARSDPSAHAERVVISDHCAATGQLHLRGHEIYCTIEPCLMCCGAIHWAKLDRVVYGLSQERLQTLSGGTHKPGVRGYLPVGGRPVEVVGPVLEDEAFALAARYAWRRRAL